MYFLYFVFWQKSQIKHYLILNNVLYFGVIWGSFISRENTPFSSTQLEWNTKEEKKDFAPAESLRRDEEPPSPLNCIPTSFCLTRELHSGKLGSFPHQTLRGQK